MAEKRMFSKLIIDSDAFLDMPLTTQALYFHLNMRADDDGFVNNPKKIQRTIGAGDDDLRLLIMKNFIITFQSGVIVIKHWKMHNYIQADRYKPTAYLDEKKLLSIKSNKSYTLDISDCEETLILNDVSSLGTECVQDGDTDKIRLDKNSIYVDFFEQLWKLYPKKEGKGQISLTQKKKLYSIGIEEMTRAINRYIEAKKGVEKQFLKQGSTFFNSGYMDYLDANYESDKPKSNLREVKIPEGWED
jgi:2-oxoglutarate dehydrogenase complex dehydrogenase (E1) component-like enzyme